MISLHPLFYRLYPNRRFRLGWWTFYGLGSYGLLTSLLSPVCWAQPRQALINELVPVDGQSGDIVYTALVPVGSVPVAILADRAQHFLSRYLHPRPTWATAYGARYKIRQQGIIHLTEWRAGIDTVQAYWVTLELTLKAGRYRYCLSQFRAYADSAGPGISIPIRQLYPCDRRTYSYQGRRLDDLLAWDRGVRTYVALLLQAMRGQSKTDAY